MARTTGRLTALKVERATKPGMYADGAGLYMRVTPERTKNWVLRFMLNGRARWMGLGPYPLFGLADARDKALAARRQRHEGIDPIDARRATKLKARLDAAKNIVFKQCATDYIKSRSAGWRSPKHAAQWTATLETYVYPVLGDVPVQMIDTALVRRVLDPIWSEKAETASRVRQRIEAVLDSATALDYREGVNPARWRGHLEKLLPALATVRSVKHWPALPYTQIGEFTAVLRAKEGIGARALEFTILTAVRTSDTIKATWKEFDPAEKVWTLPADRHKSGKKTGRSHRVPLSPPTVAILAAMRKLAGGEPVADAFVFPGSKRGKPLSGGTMEKVVKDMNADSDPPTWRDIDGRAAVPHGFRSTFKDWVRDQTRYQDEVSEAALAHVIGNKTEAAYARSDVFEKRRRLMADWAGFCANVTKRRSGNVVSIAAASA